MAEYEAVVEKLDIPKGMGIDAFLLALRRIVSLPKVTRVLYEHGKVEYTRFKRTGETARELQIDFETVAPSAVVRNTELKEITTVDSNAAVAIARMFREVSFYQLHPIAFVGSPQSLFWGWHERSTGLALPETNEDLYGLQFLRDRHFEDHVLILCAGYGRGAGLLDTQRAFKITIPPREEEVRILQ